MNIENIELVINQWNIFEHVAQALSKKKHTVNENLDPLKGGSFWSKQQNLHMTFWGTKKFGVPVRDCFDTQSILYDKDIQKEAAYHS